MSTQEIRIFVADLAAYNAGTLHGVWINATDDPEEIKQHVNAMLAASPEPDAEEYAIHDYEGFDTYRLSEYEGLETAHEIACFIEEYSDFGSELLSHFGDVDEALRAAGEDYCGCYRSLADYAQELTEETTDIPANLTYYIDYESMGRDMALNGDVFTIETAFEQVHVFWSR